MPRHMPPVPPASRNKKGPRRDPQGTQDKKSVKHEHHPNAAEEGDTANIKQNRERGLLSRPAKRLIGKQADRRIRVSHIAQNRVERRFRRGSYFLARGLPKAAETSFFFMRAFGLPRCPRFCSSVPSPIMPG